MPWARYQDLIKPIQQTGLELGGGRGHIGVETILVLAVLFVGVVGGVVLITPASAASPRKAPSTFAAAGLRRHPAISAAAGQPGRRDAHHLRQQLAAVPPGAPPVPGQCTCRLAGPIADAFHRGDSWTYNVLYVILIYFFCYFWTAITFNPKDMSDNLKDYGTFIPGYRPGRRTADYLEKVMVRITYVGAGFLAMVAILPTLVSPR